jgi:hypothetical protein
MTPSMTQNEIDDLKIGDLIYYWYPVEGIAVDLFEYEIIGISDSSVTVQYEEGLSFVMKYIPKSRLLLYYSSRNEIEEFCIRDQCRLTGKQPRDFRHLNVRE